MFEPRSEELNKRWVCLFDRNDEAIFGLRSLAGVNLKVFPKHFAVPLMSLLSIFALPMTLAAIALSPSLMLAIDRVLDYNLLQVEEGRNFLRNVEYLFVIPIVKSPDALERMLGTWIVFTLPTLIVLVVSFCLTLSVLFASPYASKMIASLLDMVTGNAIRKTAFGNDTLGEIVLTAEAHPPWGAALFQPLPVTLSAELNEFSNAEASKAVPRLRSIIHDLAFFGNVANPNVSIAQYLTWNELVHTSYFAIPRFRKLIYYIIANSEGFKPTQAFLDDSDYELVADWYKEIQPRATEPQAPATTTVASSSAGLAALGGLLRGLLGWWDSKRG
jgi:hypothetical protein